MNLENKIKKQLMQLKESHDDAGHQNYMFFGNLQQMHRQTKLLMQEDHNMIDNILKEHDWAQDHIAEAKVFLTKFLIF
jgi:hypothetical protein